MIIKMYLVDTFADGLFSGGRAGVALLRHLGQEVFLQALAQEMGLPVTAYVLPFNNDFMVRYFTPEREIGVADSGALAAAHVVYGAGLAPVSRPVTIHGRGGRRQIAADPEKGAGFLSLTLDPVPREKADDSNLDRLYAFLNMTPEDGLAVFSPSLDHLVVLCRSQAALKRIQPGGAAQALGQSFTRLTLSGPLEGTDCPGYGLRCFTPAGESGDIPPNFDLHAVLAPFWAERLGRARLEVHYQAARTCLLWAEPKSDGSVLISGHLNTIFKADPVLNELTGDGPQELMF